MHETWSLACVTERRSKDINNAGEMAGASSLTKQIPNCFTQRYRGSCFRVWIEGFHAQWAKLEVFGRYERGRIDGCSRSRGSGAD